MPMWERLRRCRSLAAKVVLAMACCMHACTHAWAQTTAPNGEAIFKNRCVVCHGAKGDGHSDLARIMRPPPANLRASKLTDAEKSQIVRKGGEAVKRSPNMPVWELELDEQELQAVLGYIATLKEPTP